MKEFINNKLTILVNDPNQEKAISQTFPNVVETYDETKAQQFAKALVKLAPANSEVVSIIETTQRKIIAK
ncbi:hypothetical protein U1329_08135 [Enterococcus cecorum]|uniref:hypothetical protein n=1 Tax=Enterococcus cecorum TaxID=44008 RepID=UPI0006414CE4|nr:hypothetical protein [Enterococcus cecorum]HJD16054.1 hypothetical protein [Candidatus Enterococcus stercoripullorum]KLN91347.1 hypothetical protein ABT60_11165 [Enterococcus cecorum]KLN91964.1 hypothetical protein ABT59_07910 [Enterococcus cecorum]KLO64910.1 hypothetical protein AA985_09890 [Enterococcus cecorum]KLO66557.1 hypothetical protein AA986_05780 [Enterococcus cecorum]